MGLNSQYTTIETMSEGSVLTIWLNRADRRNAINGPMVDELIDCLSAASADDDIRVVVLRGRGDYFCAGGDLKWMGSGEHLAEDERPATRLAYLFSTIFSFPKPLLVVVHGVALGGALGLVATADFVIADPKAIISFTELRLGLIPAVISPFVIRRIGSARARRLMLSATALTADEARKAELIDMITGSDEIESSISELCAQLSSLAPGAMKACKRLINNVSERTIDSDLIKYTANQLHEIQHGPEAREGVAAFFEKRRPSWNR